MAPKIRLDVRPAEIREAFAGLFVPIKDASERAVEDVERSFKADARGEMAKAGFSRRFQNATRTRVYKGADARNALGAVFLWHRSEWAGVHEEGATIHGKPTLFLPLRNTPKKVRGRTMSVENYRIAGLSDLFPIKSKSGKTLLAAKVRLPKTQADKREPKVSMAALRRGTAPGRGVIRSVPLFVGVRSVTIPKRLNVTGAAERARDALPQLYLRHLQAE
jgi:hypothetical protein